MSIQTYNPFILALTFDFRLPLCYKCPLFSLYSLKLGEIQAQVINNNFFLN